MLRRKMIFVIIITKKVVTLLDLDDVNEDDG